MFKAYSLIMNPSSLILKDYSYLTFSAPQTSSPGPLSTNHWAAFHNDRFSTILQGRGSGRTTQQYDIWVFKKTEEAESYFLLPFISQNFTFLESGSSDPHPRGTFFISLSG